MYKLKNSSNEFQVTREGKFEYRHFRHGELYEEIPAEDAGKFEVIGAIHESPLQAEIEGRRPGRPHGLEGGKER